MSFKHVHLQPEDNKMFSTDGRYRTPKQFLTIPAATWNMNDDSLREYNDRTIGYEHRNLGQLPVPSQQQPCNNKNQNCDKIHAK